MWTPGSSLPSLYPNVIEEAPPGGLWSLRLLLLLFSAVKTEDSFLLFWHALTEWAFSNRSTLLTRCPAGTAAGAAGSVAQGAGALAAAAGAGAAAAGAAAGAAAAGAAAGAGAAAAGGVAGLRAGGGASYPPNEILDAPPGGAITFELLRSRLYPWNLCSLVMVVSQI